MKAGEDGVGRDSSLPGWRWPGHVTPIPRAESRQADHMGYVISGRMRAARDDGEEMEYGPGDVAVMPPAPAQKQLLYVLEGWQHDAG